MNEERMQYSVSLEYVARIHMFISVLMKEQWKRLCARETLRKTKNIYFIVRVYTRSDVSQELVKNKNKKKKQQTALKKQKQKQKNDNNNNNEAVKSQLKRKRKALRSDYEPIKKKKNTDHLGRPTDLHTHKQTNTQRDVCVS